MSLAAHAIEKIIPAAKPVERVVAVSQDSVGFVVFQSEDLPGTEANGEHGPSDNRRHDALEAASVDGQFRFEDGMFMIQNCSAPGCNSPERTGRLCGGHLANPGEALNIPSSKRNCPST